MTLTESDYTILKKGDQAPDFILRGTEKNENSLQEIKGEKATLIIFMCNHCPYVIPKLPEIQKIAEDFTDVAVIGINSNNEATHPADSFENMQKLMEQGYTFHYLRDETQEVAKAYGATCTPDPFLFDQDLKLIHHSRFDNAHGDNPTNHELYNTIKEFLETGTISTQEQPSMGCNVKWK